MIRHSGLRKSPIMLISDELCSPGISPKTRSYLAELSNQSGNSSGDRRVIVEQVLLFASYFVVFTKCCRVEESRWSYSKPMILLFLKTTIDAIPRLTVTADKWIELDAMVSGLVLVDKDRANVDVTKLRNNFNFFIVRYANIIGVDAIEPLEELTAENLLPWIPTQSAYLWIWLHIMCAVETSPDRGAHRALDADELVFLFYNLDFFIGCPYCRVHFKSYKETFVHDLYCGQSLLTMSIKLHTAIRNGQIQTFPSPDDFGGGGADKRRNVQTETDQLAKMYRHYRKTQNTTGLIRTVHAEWSRIGKWLSHT